MKRISVFGLGYVGAVSAACLAKEGNQVVGVDLSVAKVEIINSGHTPIIEAGMDELMQEAVAMGNLTATTDSKKAVLETDISIICVGTPSRTNGSLDLSHIESVCREIGAALAEKTTPHVIVARSTMLPGTIHGTIAPTLEAASGKKAGVDFHVCINPEFLREGKSLYDFYNPPFILIGADHEDAAKAVTDIYSNVSAPIHVVSVRTAEMVKYTCNCWHAAKVSFANEIGNICKPLGIDSHEVMRLVCLDTKLNLSPYYMIPGFAFGGSCLPKDLRALTYKAREMDVAVPMLNALLPGNRQQIERAVDLIAATKTKRVGICGLSFKAGTDDLRESPMVTLVETLIGRGYDIAIYDSHVSVARLVGANKTYIEKEIPHIDRLMRTDLAEVVAHAETLVIGTKTANREQLDPLLRPDLKIVDLVRIWDGRVSDEKYQGICW